MGEEYGSRNIRPVRDAHMKYNARVVSLSRYLWGKRNGKPQNAPMQAGRPSHGLTGRFPGFAVTWMGDNDDDGLIGVKLFLVPASDEQQFLSMEKLK
jgi:hypothetical protein